MALATAKTPHACLMAQDATSVSEQWSYKAGSELHEVRKRSSVVLSV